MKASIVLALGVTALLAIAGAAGYAAFANHGSPSSAGGASGGEGTLRVYVQDAPTIGPPVTAYATTNWTHVYVTFTEVQVHPVDGNESTWINVTTGDKTVDLANLVTVSQLLGSANLSSGMYTQLRIVVEKAWGVMENGTEANFTVPSSELKTDDPFNITTGKTTSLTVEIDVSRSIVQADGMWIFVPVIGSVRSS